MYAGEAITVVVTTVGDARRSQLRRALESVWNQQLQPEVVVIAQDTGRRGAPYNRQRGTDSVATEWVAYLDDDDEFYPQHLIRLASTARETGADLVFPWFDVHGGQDPFPHHEGQPWDDADPRQIPVTFLARTAAIRAAGGWDDQVAEVGVDPEGNRAGEDWRLTLRLIGKGSKIVHLPERTWRWHHHGLNSSGLPQRINWETVG